LLSPPPSNSDQYTISWNDNSNDEEGFVGQKLVGGSWTNIAGCTVGINYNSCVMAVSSGEFVQLRLHAFNSTANKVSNYSYLNFTNTVSPSAANYSISIYNAGPDEAIAWIPESSCTMVSGETCTLGDAPSGQSVTLTADLSGTPQQGSYIRWIVFPNSSCNVDARQPCSFVMPSRHVVFNVSTYNGEIPIA
jgi:hypothetical protein